MNPIPNLGGVEFLALCEARHSVRSFQDRPIDDVVVERILACARSAPYASGRKGWDVLVVRERATIDRMAQAVQDRTEAMTDLVRPDFSSQWIEYSRNFHAFASAPVLFVPVFRPGPSLSALLQSPDETSVRYDRENHIKSISGATMLLLLAAQAEGLGACPMTGPLLAASELNEILGIRHGREIAAIVPVGHPTENIHA